MEYAGFDFETRRFGHKNLAPRPICLAAVIGKDAVLGTSGDGDIEEEIGELLDLVLNDDFVLVAHNLKFDLAVICSAFPRLIPDVFQVMYEGKAQCTIVREKLLNLAYSGHTDMVERENGDRIQVSYGLDDLVRTYFGEDISEDKVGENSWRTNYAELESTPLAEWPREAIDYAVKDALYCKRIAEAQDKRRVEIEALNEADPLCVSEFRSFADFCLYLMSCRGLKVDNSEKRKIQEMIDTELAPENLQQMIEAGVLRPAQPPRPYKKGGVNPDGSPKMTKGTKESVNTKKLKAIVEEVCEEHAIEVELTDKGHISTKKDFLDRISYLNPVLEEYQMRQSLQKLVTTELPRMCHEDGSDADVVHPLYDVLKRTGRTSSFASDKYPSFNCQNVDPRVRNCFIPRDGFLLVSADYSQMELGTLAQTCLDLFGESVMAEKINAGIDVHAYLGSSIARAMCDDFDGAQDDDDNYEAFMAFKGENPQEWKRFRTLAKPTGLGYPGGLGAETFIAYARATYGVRVDLPTAKRLREVWHETYPEMSLYFDYINNECVDYRHSDEFGELYRYKTPFGMVRPAALFCAAANGKGLQSPAAEGALTGLINVVSLCFDVSMKSPLCGNLFPICFIHDEIVAEVRKGPLLQDCVRGMSQTMVDSMRIVTPDVGARSETALMERWDKRAEPVFDEHGNLQVWKPE